MDDHKRKALSAALGQIEKQFGKGSVMRMGDGLVMGSTTGNLWASANGGDSWSCVSTHLPPVAAVAWGSA